MNLFGLGRNQGWQVICDAFLYSRLCSGVWQWSEVIMMKSNSRSDSSISNGDFIKFLLQIELGLWISVEEEAIKGEKKYVMIFLHSLLCRDVWWCSVGILMIHNSISDSDLFNGGFLCLPPYLTWFMNTFWGVSNLGWQGSCDALFILVSL